ncbi:hypothetical protein ACWEO4_39545 [Streptomyces sp. NPDC004393]
MARSPVSNVDTARWDRTVTRTLDEAIGLQFSYSHSSPSQLGDRKDHFERDVSWPEQLAWSQRHAERPSLRT